ncbi:MAG: hypothetical protein J0G95_16410 [Rhizobiales bacterium]|nr:hypothetical protein [Hyphomicrobiales bacterium]
MIVWEKRLFPAATLWKTHALFMYRPNLAGFCRQKAILRRLRRLRPQSREKVSVPGAVFPDLS